MSQEAVRPELWEITLVAAKAAYARGREHIASGKYFSKADVPKFEQNEHGWSTTTNKDYGADKKDAPPNWTHMFGDKPGAFATLDFREVPGLASAIDRVAEIALAESEFEASLSVLAGMEKDDEARVRQIRFEYWLFLSSLIARVDALGDDSDAAWFAAYLQLEKARFADTLAGDLLVPIALTAMDVAEPLHLGDDVWIEPLDEPTQRARAVSAMWSGRVSAYVVSAATHAVVVKNITIANDRRRRVFRAQELDLTAVDRVMQCLHIETGKPTGYAQILVSPYDWADDWIHDLPPLWKVKQVANYPETFANGGWNQPKDVIPAEQMGAVPGLFQALGEAPPNVHLASRRALRAVMRDDDEDETLDSTIGIEALLLGDNDRDEVTHRMAQRAAVALAAEFQPEVIFKAQGRVRAQECDRAWASQEARCGEDRWRGVRAPGRSAPAASPPSSELASVRRAMDTGSAR